MLAAPRAAVLAALALGLGAALGIDRRLRRQALVDQATDQLEVGLDLPERPRRPSHKARQAVCQEHPGVQGVHRPLSGAQLVRALRLEGKATHPVVQEDAGAVHDLAAAERGGNARNPAHHVAVSVGDGLTDTLTRGELIDLVRFLSELGKVGPYSIGPQRIVRRWQALEPTREGRMFLVLGGGLSTPAKEVPGLVRDPAYSTVSGVLPLADAPLFQVGENKHKVSLVRCQVDVTTAGPVVVRFNSTKGLSLWVDQRPTAIEELLELNLPVGLHTLSFVVDRDVRREALRCELDDKAGSPARVRVVGGK